MDKLANLKKHLEVSKNRLNGKIVPERRKGQEAAYFDFLQREIKRTEKKIEEIAPTYGTKK